LHEGAEAKTRIIEDGFVQVVGVRSKCID
jgi:hypothetical protein